MSWSEKRFARVPERLTRLLERDKITTEGYALTVFFIARCDPTTGEWVGALQALIAAVRWTRSDEHLRQQLKQLRELGLVDFAVSQGQRAPWVIRLVGDDFGLDLHPTSTRLPTETASSLEVIWKSTSNGTAVEDAASDGAERATAPPELPTATNSDPTDRDRDADEDQEPCPVARADAEASSRAHGNDDLDDDDHEALRYLVDSLDHADNNTFATFLKNFSDLDARYFYYTADAVDKQRPLTNDAGYAYKVLTHVAIYGLPADPPEAT